MKEFNQLRAMVALATEMLKRYMIFNTWASAEFAEEHAELDIALERFEQFLFNSFQKDGVGSLIDLDHVPDENLGIQLNEAVKGLLGISPEEDLRPVVESLDAACDHLRQELEEAKSELGLLKEAHKDLAEERDELLDQITASASQRSYKEARYPGLV